MDTLLHLLRRLLHRQRQNFMQAKYTKSKRADTDIKNIIIKSMADFGEAQTDKYMQGFERALCELAEMPNRGRVFISGKTGR
ncbi:MAG: type II toxin-antitoxin system RelE/ParE family toxin, partial [bacterium]